MSKGTVNKVILLGRMGQDPEIKYAQSGVAIASISLATTEGDKKPDGTWEDRTEWHRVVAFGKTAELIGNYGSKGKMIYVEGSLRTRQWEKDGQKHYATEIVAREIQFIGGSDGSSKPAMKPKSAAGDEDVPF